MSTRNQRTQAPKRGARKATRPGLSSNSQAWVRHHKEMCADSIKRLIKHPVATTLTVLAIAIALILPAGLWIALDSAKLVNAELDDSATISVYLAPNVNESEAREIQKQIELNSEVTATRLITSAEGLDEFQKALGVDDILSKLDENPLPQSIVVSAKQAGPEAVSSLSQELDKIDGVDEVRVDLAWLNRLYQIAELGQRVALGLALLFGLGVLLVVGNTVRLAVESRRQEIEVVTLIGATHSFVRRPFLYTGAWYGLGGGIMALVILAFGGGWLASPVQALAQSYGAEYALPSMGFVNSVFMLIFSTILGWLGAWIAVGRHLSDIKPR